MAKKEQSKLLKDIPKYQYYGNRRYHIPEEKRLQMYLDKKEPTQ